MQMKWHAVASVSLLACYVTLTGRRDTYGPLKFLLTSQDTMARPLHVLLRMTALVSAVSAASVGPSSAPSLLQLRSNLNKGHRSNLVPSRTSKMEYFTSPVNANEEVLCLRMRCDPSASTYCVHVTFASAILMLCTRVCAGEAPVLPSRTICPSTSNRKAPFRRRAVPFTRSLFAPLVPRPRPSKCSPSL